MNKIVDTLYADQEELSAIAKKYPECRIGIEKTFTGFQRYLVIIPDETEDDYFTFLIDHQLAMSSTNFLRRLRSDTEFSRSVTSQLDPDIT